MQRDEGRLNEYYRGSSTEHNCWLALKAFSLISTFHHMGVNSNLYTGCLNSHSGIGPCTLGLVAGKNRIL